MRNGKQNTAKRPGAFWKRPSANWADELALGDGAKEMKTGSTWQRLRYSVVNSAGTIVFGMEDGTVSIFGLIFGVAATTTNSSAILVAGATGAAAAAVSMMAGAFLDAETSRDEMQA